MAGGISVITAGGKCMPLKEPLSYDKRKGIFEHQKLHVVFRGFKVTNANAFQLNLEHVGGNSVVKRDFDSGFSIMDKLIGNRLSYTLSGDQLIRAHDHWGNPLNPRAMAANAPEAMQPASVDIKLLYQDSARCDLWVKCDRDTIEISADESLSIPEAMKKADHLNDLNV